MTAMEDMALVVGMELVQVVTTQILMESGKVIMVIVG